MIYYPWYYCLFTGIGAFILFVVFYVWARRIENLGIAKFFPAVVLLAIVSAVFGICAITSLVVAMIKLLS